MAESTTDHDAIRRWVEERGGRPVSVKGTGGDDAGILRIDFGEPEESLEPIDWDEWFRKFDENDLEFLYQEEKQSGEGSTFFKLVSGSW